MLTIHNIRQGDGGAYTCKATNKAGSQERELFLKVFGKVEVRLMMKETKQKINGYVICCSFILETPSFMNRFQDLKGGTSTEHIAV